MFAVTQMIRSSLYIAIEGILENKTDSVTNFLQSNGSEKQVLYVYISIFTIYHCPMFSQTCLEINTFIIHLIEQKLFLKYTLE